MKIKDDVFFTIMILVAKSMFFSIVY